LDFNVSGKFGPSFLSSTCASLRKDSTSTEPAENDPPPVKDITIQREQCVNEENPTVPPPALTPSISSNEASKVEASPAVPGSNLTVPPVNQSPRHSPRKGRPEWVRLMWESSGESVEGWRECWEMAFFLEKALVRTLRSTISWDSELY
ncbi:hypothetical protein chiPu_0024513, partial [Chiloscyllium punctatum]|nr:hypothetical protein [Chiloscyllium punctatum]